MDPKSKAVRHLLDEHHTLARTLSAFEQLLDQLEAPSTPEREVFTLLVECIGDFSSLRHEEKEEALLIPALERAGMDWDSGPLAYVRREHRQVRYLISSLWHDCLQRDDWDAEDRRHFSSIGRELVEFMRRHMKNEEDYLFPEVEVRLTPELDEKLACQFEELDRALDTVPDREPLQSRVAMLLARFGGEELGGLAKREPRAPWKAPH